MGGYIWVLNTTPDKRKKRQKIQGKDERKSKSVARSKSEERKNSLHR